MLALEVDPKLDQAVRDALPVCSGAKISYQPLRVKLPARFTGVTVHVESASHDCDTQVDAITSPTGGFFLGHAVPLDGLEGTTVEQKLTNFGWQRMNATLTPTIERTRTPDGLFRVTLAQSLEAGKMPLSGEIDADGRIFFFGHFRPAATDARAARTKTFAPFVASSPAKGATNAAVTVVEFSDFQCPSCKRAAAYIDPILKKHGEKVRYVRVDLPLSGHAWAFPAALAGRAIYRQKPDVFWEYKNQVYASQSTLNAFMFWDWARNFAEDHELDLAKYDADLQSQELRTEILNGAGTALSNEIRATPSYIVNGALVEAGADGKALAEYVESLLK